MENIQRNKVVAKGRELVPGSPGVSGAGELSPLPGLFMSKPLAAPASTGQPRREGSVTESPAKGGQECRGEACGFRPNQPADYERSSGCFSRPPAPPALGPVGEGFCDPGVLPPWGQPGLSLRSTLRVSEASGGEVLKRTGVTGRGCMAAGGFRPSGLPG